MTARFASATDPDPVLLRLAEVRDQNHQAYHHLRQNHHRQNQVAARAEVAAGESGVRSAAVVLPVAHVRIQIVVKASEYRSASLYTKILCEFWQRVLTIWVLK
jgi:hypothetical protein